MAEFIMKDLVAKHNLQDMFDIASAGTSGWHNGEDMHCGTADVLDGLNIDSHGFVSCQVKPSDFAAFDYLVAMDGDNLQQLEKSFGVHPQKIFVITTLVPHLGFDGVPDPYFSDNFAQTQFLLQQACQALLDKLVP